MTTATYVPDSAAATAAYFTRRAAADRAAGRPAAQYYPAEYTPVPEYPAPAICQTADCPSPAIQPDHDTGGLRNSVHCLDHWQAILLSNFS